MLNNKKNNWDGDVSSFASKMDLEQRVPGRRPSMDGNPSCASRSGLDASASRREFAMRVDHSSQLSGCDAGCMAGD
jgi:hypothetical protein